MKPVSTVVAGALLAIGLAGNAVAAPSHYVNEKVVVVKAGLNKQHVKMYTVRRGDTLSRIAARHNTTVKKLMRLNGLSGRKANNLRVGMKIRVS